jgi:hypothetical protein
MCFDEYEFVFTNTGDLFVQILQNNLRLNNNAMAIPGRGDW